MRLSTILILLSVLSAGCHAPMPTFNMLAPYGTTRVPAPATGSIGSPDTYYQTPAYPPPAQTTPSSAVGSGLRPRPQPKGNWTAEQSASDREKAVPTPARRSAVAVASYEEATDSQLKEDQAPIRIVRDQAQSVLKRDSLAEPREFPPPAAAIEITDLPPEIQSRAIISRSPVPAPSPGPRIVRGNSTETWRPRSGR